MRKSDDIKGLESLAEELDRHTGIFTLVRGLAEGKPHWAYAEIWPSKYPSFMEAQRRGGYELMDYAKRIWARGSGEPPPIEKIKADHPELEKIDFNFEADFRQMMKEAMTEVRQIRASELADESDSRWSDDSLKRKKPSGKPDPDFSMSA